MAISKVTLEIKNSSNVASVSYDYDTEELEIKFKDKEKGIRTYVYHKVPDKVFLDITTADSVGKYINQNVKNKFHYRLVA
jgi:hypothetical protein